MRSRAFGAFPLFFHTARLIVCCSFLLCTFSGLPARAQAAKDMSAVAKEQAPRISPDQARQLTSVLNNEAKRKEFVATLQNLAQAQAAGDGESQKMSGGLLAPAQTKLRPDGLGAELLGSVARLGHTAGKQTHALIRTVVDVREVGPWWRRIKTNQEAQVEAIKLMLRALLLAGLGSAVFFAFRMLVRKPRAHLEAMACARSSHALNEERRERVDAERAARRDAQTSEAAEAEREADDALPQEKYLGDTTDDQDRHAAAEDERARRVRHQGALARLLLAVQRVPFAIGCFLLDCIPILIMPLVALLIAFVDPRGDENTEGLLRALTIIALVGGGIITVARAVLAPHAPWQRLVIVSNWAAQYVFNWLRLLVITGAIGGAAIKTLDDCGLPEGVVNALVKILALVLHLMVAVMIVRSRGPVAAACGRAVREGFASRALTLVAKTWWIVAVFFDLGLWLVWAAEIHHGYTAIWLVTLRSTIAFVVVRILSIVLYGLLERVFRNAPEWAALSEETQGRIGRYYPAARRITSALIAVIAVLAFASAWGAPIHTLFSQGGIGSRILSSGTTILIALVLGALVWEASNIAIERHAKNLGEQDDGPARVARIRTLQPMIRIMLMVVLIVVIGMTILSEIGVNVAPLLAGASIFGVALGFGSQKLVQDFINGIFLLMENALTVGDNVTLNGTYGIVEHLSLRTVHVRANDGSVNIFPFSSLGQIINYNRDFARAIIVAEVGYDTDTDDVVQAINDITAEMRADPDFEKLIIDDFQMWGVDSLNQTSVTVRGTLPTIPSGRWPVQRQFYRRMKKCFEERGFHLPYPTRMIEFMGASAFPGAPSQRANNTHQETLTPPAPEDDRPGSRQGE